MVDLLQKLQTMNTVLVHQRHEIAELIGYETRNKYEILDESGAAIGFAAEQQKGLLAFLFRQFLGHWRTFEVFVFDQNRQVVLRCVSPFRWLFSRFEVYGSHGDLMGTLQQRFSIMSRRFDVQSRNGAVHFEMVSPFLRFWTYKFMRRGVEVARIEKKWAGILSEGFTDKDNFRLRIEDASLDQSARALLLAACLFVDLVYFEKKAR